MKLVALSSLAAALYAGPASDPSELFEMRVRPVLAKNCYACHTGSKMGGLQLDSREHLLQGGKSGPAIVAGDPARSLLVRAIGYTDEKLKMPPAGKLPDDDIATLASWIKAGAVWPETAPAEPAARKSGGYVITPEQRAFWAFQPVRNPAPPEVKDKSWAKSPIDRFILAKLEARGLKPAPPADKRVLIRRATFDLTGLPPTPEDVDAFVRDRSPGAFAKVVDRMLASPQYGERWGRYWLDIARYSDDKLDSTKETPYPNSFRYRDWVIQAFNQDMPYDLFVKAQIAGDQIQPELEPALGFYALSPEFQDDRVDATTRGFLGLTVACAQCHDHKYDPIPTKDYYSLLGVFTSTEYYEYPLAPADVVKAYDTQKKNIEQQEKAIKDFVDRQSQELAEILAAKTARYMMAAAKAGPAETLDPETLEKWIAYLQKPGKEHPYLAGWYAGPGKKAAEEFQSLLLSVNTEKKLIDDKNHITLGIDPSREKLSGASLLSLERDKYVLWRDFFGNKGVLRYDDKNIERFLAPEWKEHLNALQSELAAMKKQLPPQYPFLHAIRDTSKPANQRVHIRGSAANLGEEAPRRFLAILSKGEPAPFGKGSGRLELAEAIANPDNPLTARVMVNRVWQHHFGQGIVRTASNFGQLGDRPSHPELLDYLAHRFVESHWSIKTLHREIMLSSAYALSAAYSDKNYAADPGNRLLWRANRRRLDAESLRDALLFAAGDLDLKAGGPAAPLSEDNKRRAAYGFVSRKKLDGMLSLFDFPNPNSTSEQRLETNVPLQRLFFMNSGLVMQEAKALVGRLGDSDGERAKIIKAYKLLFNRDPTATELRLGNEFLRDSNHSWAQYAQVLLSSNEFSFVD